MAALVLAAGELAGRALQQPAREDVVGAPFEGGAAGVEPGQDRPVQWTSTARWIPVVPEEDCRNDASPTSTAGDPCGYDRPPVRWAVPGGGFATLGFDHVASRSEDRWSRCGSYGGDRGDRGDRGDIGKLRSSIDQKPWT